MKLALASERSEERKAYTDQLRAELVLTSLWKARTARFEKARRLMRRIRISTFTPINTTTRRTGNLTYETTALEIWRRPRTGNAFYAGWGRAGLS